MYTVTYASDSLDPTPIVERFDEYWEAEEFIHEEVERRVDFLIQHSPYPISDKDRDEMRETEYSLVRLEVVGE